MIIESTLKCVQTYPTSVGEIHIVPGRNLIRDDAGRELMELKSFRDMLATKAPGFRDALRVVIAPAPDPSKVKPEAGKPAPVVPPEGETATTNMTVPQAVAEIKKVMVVDQLQDILARDPRKGVKAAAEARIAELAAIALSEGGEEDGEGKGEEDDDDEDDDQE